MYLTRFRFNTARREAQRLLRSPNRLHGAVNSAFIDPPARDGSGPRVLWRIDQAPADRFDLLISSPDRPDLTHLVEQVGWPSLGQEGWSTFAYGEFLNALAEGDEWAFRLTANPVHHIRREEDAPGTPTKRTAHVTPHHQLGWLLKHQERSGFAVLRIRPDNCVPAPGTTEGLSTGATDCTADARGAQNTHRTAEGAQATAESREDAMPDVQGYQVVVHNRTPIRFSKTPSGGDRALTDATQHSPGGRGAARSPASDVRFTQATFDGRLEITDLAAFRRTLTHGLGKAKAYGCGLMTLAPVR
ncbi:type I-E CRISPR-associated protein Cas6/Cse3/CasE [Streptomyces sp. NPDC003691]